MWLWCLARNTSQGCPNPAVLLHAWSSQDYAYTFADILSVFYKNFRGNLWHVQCPHMGFLLWWLLYWAFPFKHTALYSGTSSRFRVLFLWFVSCLSSTVWTYHLWYLGSVSSNFPSVSFTHHLAMLSILCLTTYVLCFTASLGISGIFISELYSPLV